MLDTHMAIPHPKENIMHQLYTSRAFDGMTTSISGTMTITELTLRGKVFNIVTNGDFVTKLPVLTSTPIIEQTNHGIGVLLPLDTDRSGSTAIICDTMVVVKQYDGDFLVGFYIKDPESQTSVTFKDTPDGGIRAKVSTGGDYHCSTPDATTSLLFMASVLSIVFPVTTTEDKDVREGYSIWTHDDKATKDCRITIEPKHYSVTDKQTNED